MPKNQQYDGTRQEQLLKELTTQIQTVIALLKELLERQKETPQWPPVPLEQERAVAPWKHLVARRHSWRKQLYVKGRNMTVRQLLGAMQANGLTPEQAAADVNLPVEALYEALAYAEKNKHLLEADAAYERHILSQGGQESVAQAVS